MNFQRRLLPVVVLLLLLPARSTSEPAGDLPALFVHLPWSPTGVKKSASYGRSLAPAGDVNGDGYGDVIVGAIGDSVTMAIQGRVYLYLGSPGGLSDVPAWTYAGEQAGGGLGNVVAPAGDVNGDGYGDVILGYDGFDTGGLIDAGKALVFHGGPNGLALTPNRTLLPQVNQVEQFFGAAVATAGDVDADGYDDVIVGAPGYSDGSTIRGAVYVYRGGPSGLPAAPSHTLLGRPQQGWFGGAVSTAGDMDADGYDDVIVGAPFENVGFTRSGAFSYYRGSPAGLITVPDTTIGGLNAESQLGTSLAYLGDQTGDGYADILVGEPGANISNWVQLGAVRRYYGGPGGITSLDLTVGDNLANFERFGTRVATMGDLNGDGYADFAATGEGIPAGGGRTVVLLSDAGEGYYYGALYPTSPAGGAVGASIATSGDVDGDGRSEILIGDPLENVGGLQYAGRVRLLTLPRALPRAVYAWPKAGPQAGTRFGNAVAIVHGFPQRGRPALLIGDPGFQGTGRVAAHIAFRGGVSTADSWAETGGGPYLSFGTRVVDAGDVNRDGFVDVVIAAPTADLFVPGSPSATMGGRAALGPPYQVGRIDLYLGAADEPVKVPGVFTGGRDFDRVGSALAGRGDVNGDGYSDLLVGAEGWDSASIQDCGKAWVLYGGPGGFTGAPWSVEGESPSRGLGASVALGDLDADGYSDAIVGVVAAEGSPGDGRVQVYYGGPAGPAATPGLVLYGNPSSPSFGRAVAALGDVTGDGICDLGVGAPLEEGVGRVYVFAGTRGRSQSQIGVWTKRGAQPDARYGEAIAGGGDLDGDGIADLAIGAPRWDALQIDEGRVEVFRGAALLPEADPAMVLASGIVGAQMGGSLAPLSDLNEDGFADLVVGASGAAGRVYAYFGAGGPGFTARLHVNDLEQGELLRLRPAPNRLGLTNEVWPRVELATAGGRGRVQVEYEIVLQNEPFTGVPTFRDPTLYDAYDNVGGNTSEYGVPVPHPGRGYHLRSRIVRKSPFFPRSRWITPDAQVTGSVDFWTSGAVVDVAPGADAALAGPRIARVAPNPAATGGAEARIDFVLPAAGAVTLDVYDVRGALVRRLRADTAAAGPGSATWDGRSASGRAVPAGIYFLELRAGSRSDRAKVVRLGP